MFFLVACLLPYNILAYGLSWNFYPTSDVIFHSYVFEKNLEIYTHPPLIVNVGNGSKLCSIHLLPTESQEVPSFISARVTNPTQGRAELFLNESALYEFRLHGDGRTREAFGVYPLKIAAEDCGHPPQITRPWAINIVLVPTESPVWSARDYTFRVDSNLPAGEIVGKVTAYAAFDFDSGQLENRLGDDTGMCAYAIDNPASSMFDINGHGVIRSRLVFPTSEATRYTMNVTGFDCHLPVPRRSTVQVTILVRPGCAPHWQNMSEEIIYAALSTPQFIAPVARLQLCDTPSNASCEVESTALRVKLLWTTEKSSQLALDNPADTCDLDLLSLRAQRKICGISTKNLIELLPYGPPSFIALNSQNQTSEGIFHFNLSNHWTITEEQLPLADHRLDNVAFTISFWMNHSTVTSHPSSVDEANGREHVLCSADSTEKNRHHFAIYLHNCKMTVLLRREPLNSKHHEEPRLYPSQWRFAVDEVCDSNWHHYSVVFQPLSDEQVHSKDTQSFTWNAVNQMRLYVDGEFVSPEPDLVRVAEDIPLRQLHGHPLEPTRMSVGACWHSRLGRFVQHFSGQLAGLTLSRGHAESDEHLTCLTNCCPRLHIHGQVIGGSRIIDLPPLHQSQLDNLLLEANHPTELSELLHQVVYFNPRLLRKPNQRSEPLSVHVNTIVRYKNQCINLTVPDRTIRIIQLPISEHASMTLAGNSHGDHLRLDGRVYRVNNSLASDVSHALSLTAGEKSAISNPIEISTTTLHSGVLIFPLADLSWKPVTTSGKELTLNPNGVASYCDVEFCDHLSTDSRSFIMKHPKEFIYIEPEFLQPGLRFNRTTNGARLDGPANVVEFSTALRHLQWVCMDSEPVSRRCFRAVCTAEFETMNTAGTTSSLRIQSNAIQTEFVVRQMNGKGVEPEPSPRTLEGRNGPSLGPHELANSPLAQQHQAVLREPRVLRDLGGVGARDGGSTEATWDRSEQMTYTLIGCAVAVLLLLVALATISVVRSQKPHTRTTSKGSHLRASPRRLARRTASYQPIGTGATAMQSESLQLFINPITNQRELAEQESKFCFYDRQLYDDEPDNASEAHEDLSDFDRLSDRPTGALASQITGPNAPGQQMSSDA
ncbi:hypothetical protein P879_03606 [Paragonimus westermani]|uniref:Calsyntenin-1 n=1 Tax=Paragonimus westermani TaxID=34504 RepID=A0A8T0DGM3_9TREM|nr:hypothetical protein P879_03606 [Paragonimus westermani]